MLDSGSSPRLAFPSCVGAISLRATRQRRSLWQSPAGAYARRLFGDADPIGQCVGYEPAPNDQTFPIVGEAADARVNGAERDSPPVIYMDLNQKPAPVNGIRVRAVGDPSQLSDSVRRALYEIDPSLPVRGIVPLATELNGDLGTETLLARHSPVQSRC